MSTTRGKSAKTSKTAPARKPAATRKRASTSKCAPAPKATRSRKHTPAESENPEQSPATESEDSTWTSKMQHYRQRQASVASILDGLFGRLADCAPELWERRAYLMLVGLVYERLAVDEDEIPTEELVKLAKVLAENRRIEARLLETAKDAKSAEAPESTGGDLPDHLAEVVRQVYGTNFQPPEASTTETAGA